MIHSMTGYAVRSHDLGHATLHIELKSVNARYLDIAFRIGDELRQCEMPLRELLAARLQRGKVELRAHFLPVSGVAPELSANAALLTHLAQLQAQVRRVIHDAPALSVAELLRWPGVLGDQALDPEQLLKECLALAALALDDFIATRQREGAKLATMLRERVARMRDLVGDVTPLLPRAVADYQERLAAKLREAVASLDEERIRQEIGVFANRVDVSEELSRLLAHLGEVDRVLDKGGAAGKRLDFLMQELNREANTLASKSVSAEVTAVALELKLLIEQMREQVQNIE
jgi:uncharacterized protein (TIGR00255 family)